MEYKVNLTTLFWICNQFGGVRKKWTTLYHNGVMFPPEYTPINVPVIYNGKPIYLSPEAEEAATFYAKYLGTDYTKISKFNRNFWHDWKQILGKNSEIQSLDGVDFTEMVDYLDRRKEEKKMLPKEEKEAEKQRREQNEAPYRVAIIDGKPEPIGNFRVEPPGIFIGRGDHPKIGQIKHRIYPEDVTLNLSSDAPIPPTMAGHHWGNIISDRTVDWLASWKDEISGKTKYVWLGAHSSKKGESDMAKFDVARKLKRRINTIREENMANMSSAEPTMRQLATAVYLIDTFALRVGNEKGIDEADTVGVTSLRVEHITLLDNDIIRLDFLGKDSVRYLNVATVDHVAYMNLADFTKGKGSDDKLFDLITTNDVNRYLQTFMKGLTAKVFRTFNASYLFSRELRKIDKKYENYEGPDKIKLLLDEFNKANLKVAKQMNHQRKISKSFSEQVDKINDQIRELSSQLRSKSINPARRVKIRKKIGDLKVKKNIKMETKNLALGTSKTSYIDPRITVAFIKKYNIPAEKIFSRSLIDKFDWAFKVGPDYKF
jgi:DNA topoisomerase-1